MKINPEFIYIAFDVFPSQKGASTHINHCLKALQTTFKSGLLICLGHDDMPTFQYDSERNLYIYRWKEKIVNILERTEKFQLTISQLLNSELCSQVKLIHFRDIWGGIPALKNNLHCKTVFEVNSFSHIELPNRYPNISKSVLQKIEKIERYCISNSDIIITPSNVTKRFIQDYFNVNSHKVSVIPNGVTIYKTKDSKKNRTSTSPYILYFGALQKWQGIKTLFKGLKELNDFDIKLLICSSVPEKRTLIYRELSKSIGVNSKIDWLYELDKNTLAEKIINAQLTIAPLSACNRNIIQGCNPLKILESMAYGTPVLASNIPVVTEIIKNKDLGFLVPPDRPEVLGRQIRFLLEQPEVLKLTGTNGKKEMEKNYLWKDQENKMTTIYKTLLEYA